MRILTHKEAAELLEQEQSNQDVRIDDEARRIILLSSGLLDEWVPILIGLYKINAKLDEEFIFKYFIKNDTFQDLLSQIPVDQRQYFINPQLSDENDFIRIHKYVDSHGKIFSPLFSRWIIEQKIFDSTIRQGNFLTASEEKTLRTLYRSLNQVTKRDDIAKALWGNVWFEKYSEYMIDKTIHTLRRKIMSPYKIVTLKNKGYVLTKDNQSVAIPSNTSLVEQPEGITPHSGYFQYMNNKRNVRKTLIDLFDSMYREGVDRDMQTLLQSPTPLHVLVINSFSFDNVDAIHDFIAKRHNANDVIIFSNFNDSALKIHQKRVEELKLPHIEVLYDDIRNTRLVKNSFDLVVNDFRLNFNSHHTQNVNSMKNIRSLLKKGGKALISVVVDPRFESARFGEDQEKAPINKYAPSTFIVTEKLLRYCFTIPYYKQLFKLTGFDVVREFDIEEGKSWYKKLAYTPDKEPSYRRFLLQ